MTSLFANPYNICATGFYFETVEEYEKKIKNCFDGFGMKVEEFEIQFIDGEMIDAKLFDVWGVHQGNFHHFLDAIEVLEEHEKIALIAMGECGYDIDENTNTEDVSIYYCNSLKDLAIQFFEEGLYGPIPESIQYYIDYDAVARDLSFDYTELNIAGKMVIYRCP